VEEWKSALMILRDGVFFDLLRSVFGNIRTPFNKQRLLAELSAFLSREEIKRNISIYIDRTDAKLIAAVAALGQPGPADLGDFFNGEIDREDLRDLLVNLEERFILFRFQGKRLRRTEQGEEREDPVSCLALNPVLEPVLAPFAAAWPLVFPSVSVTSLPGTGDAGPETSRPPLNDRLLAALASFARAEGNLFKASGYEGQAGVRDRAANMVLRKKVREAGARIFPGLDLEALMGGLYCLGLLNGDGKESGVNEEKLADFQELSPRDRLVYCAAGICRRMEAPSPDALSPHLSRNRVRFLVSLIHRFLGILNPSRAYPRTTLRRYAETLLREESQAPGQEPLPVFDNLLAGMEIAGLLRRVSDYWLAEPGPAAEAPGSPPDDAAPALAMDASFSFVIYPGIAFADALELASFTLVREAGTVVRFELNRESAIRGFDRGMGAEEMGKLLTRLSGNRLQDTLLWTLGDWEKRYGEVSLYEGIVLSLSPERSYLAEVEPVASLVRRVLAPGVFLLSAQGYFGQGIDAAMEALRKAGVDIIARHGDTAPRKGGPASPYHSPAFPPPRTLAGRRQGKEEPGTDWPEISRMDTGEGETVKISSGDAEALKDQFRTALGKLSRLSRMERDELSARIDRRLVLSESQLSGVSLRYEKLEARGLDYVGKAMIAKQAIASRSLVELSWPGGSESRIFGIPLALEKQKLESVLVLEPSARTEDPLSPGGQGESAGGNTGGNLLHIPLGKISLLRRIKKSIFET
jgi:hypothetical protein